MVEEGDAPDALGNEPIGLAAALRERQGSAQRAQSSEFDVPGQGAEPAPSAALSSSDVDQWRFKVDHALRLIDQRVKAWCPAWEPPTGAAREEGVQAWCELLVLLKIPKIHPGYQVAGFMLFCYGPPLWVGWKARQKLAADARAAQG